MKYYLLLDQNNLLEEVGTISLKEATEELDLTKDQFELFVNAGKLFRNKYILVEKEFKDIDGYEERFIISYKNFDYYISNKGDVFSECNGKRRKLSKWLRSNKVVTKVACKEVQVAYLVAKHFIREYYDGCIVVFKDNNPRNLSWNNLNIISRSKICSRNAKMNKRSKKKVGLYKNNKRVQTFESAKQAAKDLNYCYYSVRAAATGRIKNPYYDLRYIE